ncbi:MAG TPA: nuclear transport factor 2 family protein [Solirubrobacteraceae bacterium]|jgi:ketosteroid isomerase-like protein|nr:nuclear transport factor 2 family protein [Solirubrobacteraceae bacterium]
MDDEHRTEVVRRSHEAFNERDRDGFLGSLAHDVVWHVPGRHPLAGTYHGRESVWADFMDPMWASPARVEDEQILVRGDHVVALGHSVHNFGAGEQHFETVEVLRVEDGRVAERWEFTSGQAELDTFFTRGCAAAAEQVAD